jgi:hypothetical protein
MGMSEEITETDLRGRLASRWSDSNQLSLYMHWAKVLEAQSWGELKSAKHG